MVGPVLGRQLVSYCGSPEAVFRTPVRELARIPQIGAVIARHIQNPAALCEAEEEVRRLEKEGVKAIGYLDSAFPGRLRHFEESPLVLYMRGDADLQTRRTVGIVGTRKPSPLGRLITEELVGMLVPYGVTVISGMAHGVDSAAHHSALQHGVPTIGVLGHGFHTLYPAAHRALARKMDGPHGLITEFTWHTRPDKENFPMRNRIIAGLSDALVVIESKEKGGSMITAEMANRFNKDVFAIPGRVNDPQSKGCHLLIKRHKAHLMEDANDLAEIMGWETEGGTVPRQAQGELFPDLGPQEMQLVEILRGREEMLIDELGFHMQLTPGSVSALLLGMEFKGLVHQLPGKRYALARGI